MEESDEDPGCEICSQVQEILSRTTETEESFSKEDVVAFLDFFRRWQEFRDCRCLASPSGYWALHNKVRELFKSVVVPTIASIPRRLWRQLSADYAPEGGDSAQPSPAPSEDKSSTSSESQESLDEFSLEFQARLIEFGTQIFFENSGLYTMYRKDFGPDLTVLATQMRHSAETQRACYPLVRMVNWCETNTNIVEVLENVFSQATKKTLPLKFCQMLIHIAAQIWHFSLTGRSSDGIRRIREAAVKYLLECSGESGLMREAGFRMSAEQVWVMGREEGAEEGIDKPGVELAVALLHCTLLTPRLFGLNQINAFIASINDGLTAGPSSGRKSECVQPKSRELAQLLSEQDVIGRLFGPKTHPELLKQSLTVLDFLSLHGSITRKNVDCIWAAAQKKEYSRQVCDLLCSVIKNMELSIILYIYDLLKSLKGPEHSEMTINVAYLIIETLWQITIYRSNVNQRRQSESSEPETSSNSDVGDGLRSGMDAQSQDDNTAELAAVKRKEPQDTEDYEPKAKKGRGESPIEISIDPGPYSQSSGSNRSPAKSSFSWGAEGGSVESGWPTEPPGPALESPRGEMMESPPSSPRGQTPPPHVQKQQADVMEYIMKNKQFALTSGGGSDSEVSSDRETSGSDRMVEYDGSDDMELNPDRKLPPQHIEGDIHSTMSGESLPRRPERLPLPQFRAPLHPVLSPTISTYAVPPAVFHAVCSRDPCINMEISDVCQPGSTLLWDLLQKDEDKLGPDEEKLAFSHLLALLEKIPSYPIRKEFIISCSQNLRKREANVVSLRLITRLLGFVATQKARNSCDEEDLLKELTLIVQELKLLPVFFDNLAWYYDHREKDQPVSASHNMELTARFGLLRLLFSSLSAEEPQRALEYLDSLWKCAFVDVGGGKTHLCHWLIDLFRSHLQDCPLVSSFMRHIIQTKLEDFIPESLTLTEFALLEAMLELGEPIDSEACLPLTWNIFLRNHNSSVSVKAMTSLSSYYIHSPVPEEVGSKERAFIDLCTRNLNEACTQLEEDFSTTCLTVINRGLLILKSHVDAFRRKYGYHLRLMEIKDPTMRPHIVQCSSHMESLATVRISLQVSGSHEKFALEPLHCETLGELRAEIWEWLKNYRLSQSPSLAIERCSANAKKSESDFSAELQLGTSELSAQKSFRLFSSGKELKPETDDQLLCKTGIRDKSHILVSFCEKKGGGSLTSGTAHGPIQPPPPDSTPMALLSAPHRWTLLMRAIKLLLQHSYQSTDDRSKCLAFAQRAWEVLMLLPTSKLSTSLVNTALQSASSAPAESEEENEKGEWSAVLSDEKHNLLYMLQILEKSVIPHKIAEFRRSGGFIAIIKSFLSKALFPKNGYWTDWDLSCIINVLRIANQVSAVAESEAVQKDHPVLDLTAFESHSTAVTQGLLDTILSLCTEANCQEVSELKRMQVLKLANSLLLGLLLSDPSLLDSTLLCSSTDQWLSQTILRCRSPHLRQEVMVWLYRLCISKNKARLEVAQKCLKRILASLFILLDEAQSLPPCTQNIPEKKLEADHYADKEPHGPSSRNYFWLVVQLLDGMQPASMTENDDVLLDEIALKAMRLLMIRKTFEKKECPPVDSGLSGLLMIEKAIVRLRKGWKSSSNGKKLLEVVWNLVFALPSPDNKLVPKCKTLETRGAAFDLIVELVKGSLENYTTVFDRITLHNSRQGNESLPWEFWPQDEKRSVCGYVGIVNLGATCYMATAIQHLFMIPSLRAAILNFEISKCKKHVDVLRELQKLFAFLHESKRKAYDPRDLCKAYHMDRKPLNTAEQKDMTEFFTDVLTKLEEMSGDLKILIQDLFSGSMSNNVISQDCAHVSQTTEQFYNVRCQVAEMKDLYASLDELTVADTLEGDNMYTCSQCNRKVKAKKQGCFKELPQILSFNTLRYTFNMITMMKEKVNTHFSFPEELDMRPYMEETLFASTLPTQPSPGKSQSYRYRLIGVTVHTGTAEGGHYYSYIRDPESGTKWFWFNDSDVRDWDPKNLPNECFGGEQTRHQYDTGADRFLDLSFEKANNAYMVFYKRIEPTEDISIGDDAVRKISLSRELEELIWNDNIDFVRNAMLFSHTYTQFVWQIASPGQLSIPMEAEELVEASAKLSLRHVFETLIHAKEKPTMPNWTENIIKLLNASPKACRWFFNLMSTDKRWLTDILMRCPISGCRQLLAKLILHVIIQEGEKEQQLYLAPWTPLSTEVDIMTIGEGSSIAKLIKTLLSLLAQPQIETEVRQLTEFFEVLINFSTGGPSARKFLVLIGTIRTVIGFYMRRTMQELSDTVEEESDEELGLLSLVRTCVSRSLWLSPALDRLTHLITLLVDSCRTSEGKYILDPQDTKAIFSPHYGAYLFLMQQIKDSSNIKIASSMITTVCNLNRTCTERVLDDIFRSIGAGSRDEESAPFYHILSHLCSEPETEKEFVPLILDRIWKKLSTGDQRLVPALKWIEHNLAKSPALHQFFMEPKRFTLFIERFLLKAPTFQVRYAAGECICSLIPSSLVKQEYIHYHRNPGRTPGCRTDVPNEAIPTLHHILDFLLSFLPRSEPFADQRACGNHRLVLFFNTIRACLLSSDEKRMMIPYIGKLWDIYYKHMHPHQEKICANKQALFLLWFQASQGCPEVVAAAMSNKAIVHNYMLNYIVIDSERETINFNKGFLTAYYGLARLFAAASPLFAEVAMDHDNTKFAVCNVAVRSSEYRPASDDIIGMLESCCKLGNVARVKEFKKKVWDFLRDIISSSRSNFPIFLRVLRFLVDGPDDKVYLLENQVLNMLSDVFFIIHRMYHEATLCNMIGDMSELLKRLYDFCARTEQLRNAGGLEVAAERILNSWTKAREVGDKLLSLLNSYIPHDIRRQAINTLVKMVKLLHNDHQFIFHILEFMLKAHKTLRSCLGSCNPGPFFPKRSRTEGLPEKANPPQPMLDMHLHSMLLEASKGVDPDYDTELMDYFSPYHTLIDTVLRAAINLGPALPPPHTRLIIQLSSLCGIEAIPLQLLLFPKLWLDVHERSEEKELMPLQEALWKSDGFEAYVIGILTEDFSSLALPLLYQFFQAFESKILPEFFNDAKLKIVAENVKESLSGVRGVKDGMENDDPRFSLRLSRAIGALRVVKLLRNKRLDLGTNEVVATLHEELKLTHFQDDAAQNLQKEVKAVFDSIHEGN